MWDYNSWNKNWHNGWYLPSTSATSYSSPDTACSQAVSTMPSWYYIAHPWARPALSSSCATSQPVHVPTQTLTDEEARCYWQNYPSAARANRKQDLALSTDNATFSYNYFAKQGEKRNT